MGVNVSLTFTDAPGTRRADLTALVDSGGIRSGDVLRLCALSDLGHGAASKAMQTRIEALGATIEVMPPQKVAEGGRLSKKHPRRADMCAIWWSSLDQADALDKIGRIAGQKVNRNQVNRLCKYSRNPDDRTLD
jgi:hypothetical protein